MALDLSCRDWEDRIREGRSLLPALPLNAEAVRTAVGIFNLLRLPDVPGTPALGEACGPWFREIVGALLGSIDATTGQRSIREAFVLACKKQSKTSYGAGLMLTALLMNERPRAEFLLIAPTKLIAELAFSQVVGMVQADPEGFLQKRIHVQEHLKQITDRRTRAKLMIKAFDAKVLTGVKPAGVLIDELHEIAKNAKAEKIVGQLRGGLLPNPEGFLVFITTQSDEQPTGVFKAELDEARAIRDGRPGTMLPVLYEFPADIAKDPEKWQDPANWPMVLPNLGRSITIDRLLPDFDKARHKDKSELARWASQHLNIEVGLGLHTKRWRGAEYWERQKDPALLALPRDERLAALMARCEVICVGIDGGGLDDLFGLAVLGRERAEIEIAVKQPDGGVKTQRLKRWLSWSHAWCHRGVLEVRKSIASRLLDFERAGELTIVDDSLGDIGDIVDIIVGIRDAGLLGKVAVDPGGLGEVAERLIAQDITAENDLLMGVGQGFRLMNAIKTAERHLARRVLQHCGSALMAWCVGNVKIDELATAIRATKLNAGDKKIDAWAALMNAVDAMGTNPQASGGASFWEAA